MKKEKMKEIEGGNIESPGGYEVVSNDGKKTTILVDPQGCLWIPAKAMKGYTKGEIIIATCSIDAEGNAYIMAGEAMEKSNGDLSDVIKQFLLAITYQGKPVKERNPRFIKPYPENN